MASPQDPEITIASLNDHLSSDDALLPGVPIEANAIDTYKRFMQYRNYDVMFKHGLFEWEDVIGHQEFVTLQELISDVKAGVDNIPDDLKLTEADMNPTNYKEELPKFLNAIFQDPDLRSHPTVLDILDISPLSFVKDLGKKLKEGVVEKNVDSVEQFWNSWFGHLFTYVGSVFFTIAHWERRWLVLKESCIAVINEDKKAISEVLLFDSTFKVAGGMASTGEAHGLTISSDIQDRKLHYRCQRKDDLLIWTRAIKQAMTGPGKVWVEDKRFDSFAPERNHCTATWFVDGESYFAAVADALESAKDEIFIADWAMAPELFLKRPPTVDLKWRLDQILKRKAESGVRVYVLLYSDIELATDLDSDYAAKVLRALHPNVFVIRHPDTDDRIVAGKGAILYTHHEKSVIVDQTIAFVGGLDIYFNRWDTNDHHLTDLGRRVIGPTGDPIPQDEDDTSGMYQQYVGKDYYNTFIKDISDPDKPFEEHLDRNVNHRMPWHDIAMCVYGQPARDVARHFIQQHNYYFRQEKIASNKEMHLLPRKEFDSEEVAETDYLAKPDPNTTNANCQVLRSLSDWSGGLSKTEDSPYKAYLYAVDKAEHFIYIENQFFISSLPKEGVQNAVVDHVRAKIVDAYKRKKTFRVIICIPLMPEFGGVLGEDSGENIEVILHWELATLFKEGSFIDKLVNEDKIPQDEVWNYVSINALRNHGQLNKKLVTEVIYVHSKLLIVDDKITIMGSVNLNERSLRGNRDSELAIILEDKEMIDVSFDGEAVQVGKFSHTLRKHIFREHLGLLNTADGDRIVEDPIVESFYKDVWMKTAKSNSDLFEQVFGGKCIPTAAATTFKELEEFRKRTGLADTDPEAAAQSITQIKGYLVEFPPEFLKNQELKKTRLVFKPAFFQ
ncbi:phospholipase D2-like [Dysidea avara]|uniref:phospholipase D2-like n=1 Tax=Dysidea avara TaxID=196820 RepID=UPI0033174885